MNDTATDLDGAWRDVRLRLGEAARDRHSPMHMPVLGTADGDLRILVLRACDPDLSSLRFHTDARSPKVKAIGNGGSVSLLAFDPADKVQIRARGTGRVEFDGPIADAAWAQASTYARRCYLAEAAPGTPSPVPTSGLPEAVEGIRPSEDQLIPARANFAVIMLSLTQLDWLHLAHTGHRRARFERGSAAEPWQGTWLVP